MLIVANPTESVMSQTMASAVYTQSKLIDICGLPKQSLLLFDFGLAPVQNPAGPIQNVNVYGK